jgi:hypothetical protein
MQIGFATSTPIAGEQSGDVSKDVPDYHKQNKASVLPQPDFKGTPRL